MDIEKFINSEDEKPEKIDYIRAYKNKAKTPVINKKQKAHNQKSMETNNILQSLEEELRQPENIVVMDEQHEGDDVSSTEEAN